MPGNSPKARKETACAIKNFRLLSDLYSDGWMLGVGKRELDFCVTMQHGF